MAQPRACRADTTNTNSSVGSTVNICVIVSVYEKQFGISNVCFGVFYVVIDDEQGLEHRRASTLQYMNNRLSTKVSIVDYFQKKKNQSKTNKQQCEN
jgi:hypothetical protein